MNYRVLSQGRTYNQGSRETPSVRVWHQQKSLNLFLNNFSFLSFFCPPQVTKIFICLFITQWYIFSDSGASHLQSCTLWNYPSCPIKNKHPEKRLVRVFGPEIIFGRIIKLLLTSAPWGTGKEHEELRIAGLRIWTKKISNAKQDWTVNDKLYMFIPCVLQYRWILYCTYPTLYAVKQTGVKYLTTKVGALFRRGMSGEWNLVSVSWTKSLFVHPCL